MTKLFAPAAWPRVFALPPGADFCAALVAGLDARLGDAPPEAVSDVEIWLNTRRAERRLRAAFADGPPRLLPRLRVLSDLATDPLAPHNLPPEPPPLRSRLALSRLVGALVDAGSMLASSTAVFDLARTLEALLEELQGEGIDPAAIADIDPGPHAEHWQESLRFLRILIEHGAAKTPRGAGRLRAAAEAWARHWEQSPRQTPVLVAGSTGSRGPTRAFMAAVAALPQGAVILPGVDSGLPGTAWQRLDPDSESAADHPQSAIAMLSRDLGVEPAELPLWYDAGPSAPERNRLVSLALRPAPVTDQWRAEGAALAGTLGSAMAGLTWLTAPDPRGESRAIALALRDAAQDGRTAALITPDRTLSRRVTAELARWRLIPDDSAGRPLALTPPGVFLRLIARLSGAPLEADRLLALLKHPFCGGQHAGRIGHLRLTQWLEHKVLRGGPPEIDWDRVALRAASDEAPDGAVAWVGWLRATLSPLTCARSATLGEHVAQHISTGEKLAAGPAGGASRLWDKEAGTRARAVLAAMEAESDAIGPLDPAGYQALLATEMAQGDVPDEAVVPHPGIAIWGTLEARVQRADLVILGGLVEGVWPTGVGADPWLNRSLRRALGLPSPEERIGLSAHDFQQAIGAPEVLVSHAARDSDAPTVPSRWLLRLRNLLAGLGPEGTEALEKAEARGRRLLDRAAALDVPDRTVPAAPRPSPHPPAALRPKELSVTQIETLVRDPYAIYARKVLGLRPLDPLGRVADPLTRGTAMHAIMDAFVAATVAGLPPDAEAVLADVAAQTLAQTAPWPAVREIWAARIARAAPWICATEADRRGRGHPLAREVRGRWQVHGLPLSFAVTARADRIDLLRGGGYAIYDYKSGGVPGEREVRAFHLQLPLEALILAEGGFEGVPPGTAEHLELIGLGRQIRRPVDATPERLGEIRTRLARLITHYQSPEAGFTARLRPQRVHESGDYDHLSRFGEWAASDPPGGSRQA